EGLLHQDLGAQHPEHLLIGDGLQVEPAPEPDARPLEGVEGGQQAGKGSLHARRAAAPDPPLVEVGRERGEAPGGGVTGGDDVKMAVPDEGRAVGPAPVAGEAHPAGGRFMTPEVGESQGLETLFQPRHRGRLVPRRVGGVDLDQLLGPGHQLGPVQVAGHLPGDLLEIDRHGPPSSWISRWVPDGVASRRGWPADRLPAFTSVFALTLVSRLHACRKASPTSVDAGRVTQLTATKRATLARRPRMPGLMSRGVTGWTSW